MSDKKEARRESRTIAVETLFSYLAREGKVELGECFQHVLGELRQRNEDSFAEDLIRITVENLGKIKLVIRVFAPEFPFKKIAPINRAILILGLTEMKFLKTPPIVVINEYIELAKVFGEQKSAGFVNAVLDSFRKQIGLDSENKEKGKRKKE